MKISDKIVAKINEINLEIDVQRCSITRSIHNTNYVNQPTLRDSASQNITLPIQRLNQPLGLTENEHQNNSVESISNLKDLMVVRLKIPLTNRIFLNLSANTEKLRLLRLEFGPAKIQSVDNNSMHKKIDSAADSTEFSNFKDLLPLALSKDLQVLTRITGTVHQHSHYFLIITVVLIVYRHLLSDAAIINKTEGTFCNIYFSKNASNSTHKVELRLHHFVPTCFIGSCFIQNIFDLNKGCVSKKELASRFYNARIQINNFLTKIINFGLFLSNSLFIYQIYIALLALALNFLKLLCAWKYAPFFCKQLCLFIQKHAFFTLIFYIMQLCFYFYVLSPYASKVVVDVINFITQTILLLIYVINQLRIILILKIRKFILEKES